MKISKKISFVIFILAVITVIICLIDYLKTGLSTNLILAWIVIINFTVYLVLEVLYESKEILIELNNLFKYPENK